MTESAIASGPGSLSRRTDMQALNPDEPPYGEHAEVRALQSAAAPAGDSQVASAPGGGPVGPDFSSLVGLSEPGSEGIPVTAGADIGPGVGPQAMGLGLSARAEDANSIDPGLLNILVHQSMRPDASPSFKRWVRQVLISRG